MIKTALFAAAAAIATVATAAPALAKDVVVPYGDLDLATAKGQKTFASRIDRAARMACEFDVNTRVRTPAERTCYREARATANTQMAALLKDQRLGG